MRLSYLAQDRRDTAESAKHLAQRVREPRELDFIPLNRAARSLVGKPNAALRFQRHQHVEKSQPSWTAKTLAIQSREKSTTRLVAQIGIHTVKSGSTLQSLTLERWRSGALRSGVRRSSWTVLDPNTWIWEFQ